MVRFAMTVLLVLLSLAACRQPRMPAESSATPQAAATPAATGTSTARPTITQWFILAAGPASTATVPWEADLHPLSWDELVRFIELDHTNWNAYDPDSYVCWNFANDLANNALEDGLQAGLVMVSFTSEEGHAFVWFDTTDKGRVWIEPQSDFLYPQPAFERAEDIIIGMSYTFGPGAFLVDVRGVGFEMGELDSAEVYNSEYYLDCAATWNWCSPAHREGALPTSIASPVPPGP